MKKIIAFALVCVMVLGMSTTAFAAEPWDTSAGTGSIDITAHVYSSYQVTIPATINIATQGEQCEISLSEARIEEGYHVDVFCTNLRENSGYTLALTNGASSIDCSFSNAEGKAVTDTEPLATFAKADITEGLTGSKTFTISAVGFGMPGDYTGTMNYSFGCIAD